MYWVIAYGVLVVTGIAYCLIHDQLINRRRPAKARVGTRYAKGLHHKQAE